MRAYERHMEEDHHSARHPHTNWSEDIERRDQEELEAERAYLRHLDDEAVARPHHPHMNMMGDVMDSHEQTDIEALRAYQRHVEEEEVHGHHKPNGLFYNGTYIDQPPFYNDHHIYSEDEYESSEESDWGEPHHYAPHYTADNMNAVKPKSNKQPAKAPKQSGKKKKEPAPQEQPAEEDIAICFVKAYARKPIGVPTSNLIPLEQSPRQNRSNAMNWHEQYFYNMMEDDNQLGYGSDSDLTDDDWESEESSDAGYYTESDDEPSDDYYDEEYETDDWTDDDESASEMENEVDYDWGYESYDDEMASPYMSSPYGSEWGFTDDEDDYYENELGNAYPVRRRRRRRQPAAAQRGRQPVHRTPSHEPQRRRRRAHQQPQPEPVQQEPPQEQP